MTIALCKIFEPVLVVVRLTKTMEFFFWVKIKTQMNVARFLIGLNEEYAGVRLQLMVTDPIHQ